MVAKIGAIVEKERRCTRYLYIKKVFLYIRALKCKYSWWLLLKGIVATKIHLFLYLIENSTNKNGVKFFRRINSCRRKQEKWKWKASSNRKYISFAETLNLKLFWRNRHTTLCTSQIFPEKLHTTSCSLIWGI